MYQLVYLSSTVELLSEEELRALLEQSRKSNMELGVTGMLLYHDGNIIQVLEGEKLKVMNLYSKIERDDRHRGIIRLISGEISQRDFPNWSMGFKSLSSAQYKQLLGYFDPASHKALNAPDAAEDRAALSLLKSFTASNNIY